MLFHLICVSTAVVPMRDKDLVELLHSCRLQNGRSNITGMLLYKDGHFMQVLEGEESMIMNVSAGSQRTRGTTV